MKNNDNGNGRDLVDGRFLAGNRLGKLPGTPNKSTVDLRKIRDAIIDAYNRCDGDKLMEKIAEEHPIEFLKIIASLIPKSEILEMSGTARSLTVQLTREPSPEEMLLLVQRCLSIAGEYEVTLEDVIEAMKCPVLPPLAKPEMECTAMKSPGKNDAAYLP